jgi:hypothetical protein
MVISDKESIDGESLMSPLGKGSLIALSFFSLFLSLFFLSYTLTGYSIFDLDRTDYSLTGSMLFVLSLIGFFMYFRLRNA